jgi:multicomponent Na+:H+ antiporter subunit A
VFLLQRKEAATAMPTLPFIVLSGFGAAPLAAALGRTMGARVGFVASVVPAAILALLLWASPGVITGTPILWGVPWIPDLGVAFSLRLDGLSLLFAVLISGIGTLIMLYAGSYMHGHPAAGRLVSTLLLFMGAMLGVVLADNVLTLFVFWELTSVASYLLIGLDHQREKARKAALQALVVTGVGGLALLVGLVLLGRAAGSMELTRIIATDGLADSPLYPAILVLVLLGCFTKSAQLPFHFWLPSAMEAPTPVSAYLHSSTMVKAGIYLLARLNPALGGHEAWHTALIAFGGTTIVVATILALRQTALKKLLAYSTVASLGTIVLLIGVGTEKAIIAAMAFLLGHALYKATLFMVAGSVTHITGEKDGEAISGVRHLVAPLFIAAVIAGASMAGLAPTLGFIGKEVALEAALAPGVSAAALVTLLIGAVGSVLVAMMIAIKPFIGQPAEYAEHPHAPAAPLVLCPAVLAALGLAWGLLPWTGPDQLVAASSSAVAGGAIDVKLKLWHGLTPALGWSIVALAVGASAYAARRWIRYALNLAGAGVDRVGPSAVYHALMAGLIAGADRLTRTLQNDRLRWYVAVVVFALLAVIASSLSLEDVVAPRLDPIAPDTVALAALVAIGALVTAMAGTRIKALAGLGMVGVGLASVFAGSGAPDLAMTQISVDALTIVLLLVAFRHLPDLRAISSAWVKGRDAAIAGLVGGSMGLLTWLAATQQLSPPISRFFSERSLPEGFGQNVVNVILVDFRALDTLGEITVVGIAALGVWALMTTAAGPGARGATGEDGAAADARGLLSPVLAVSTRVMLPIIALTALIVMLQGHNKPGGGFIGGLIFAAGAVLQALAFGPASARRLLVVEPITLIVVGLLLALGSGFFSPAVAFMHAQWTVVNLPGLDPLKLGTPLLFDVGVFLVVVGGSLTMILSLLERK